MADRTGILKGFSWQKYFAGWKTKQALYHPVSIRMKKTIIPLLRDVNTPQLAAQFLGVALLDTARLAARSFISPVDLFAKRGETTW